MKTPYLLKTIGILVVFIGQLHAATITWTGNHSNQWNHFQNWSPMIVPTNSDDVIIPQLWHGEIIVNGANASCKTLSYAGDSFSININIGWELILAGDLNISGNSKIIGLGGIEIIGNNDCYLNYSDSTILQVDHINIKSTSNTYLQNTLNMPAGKIGIYSGNFNSQGNDMNVNSISIIGGSAIRGLNIDNSTVTSVITNLFILNGGSFSANNSVLNNIIRISTDGAVQFNIVHSYPKSTISTVYQNAHISIHELNAQGDINLIGDKGYNMQAFSIITFKILQTPSIVRLSPEPTVSGYHFFTIQTPSTCGGEILFSDESEVGNHQVQMDIIGGANLENASMVNIKVVSGSLIVNNGMDIGNNDGISFNQTTPLTYYWINGTGNWNDPAHWSYTSGGSSSGCLPALKDHVIFNNSSGFDANDTVYISNHTFCNNLIAESGTANKPVLQTIGSTDLSLNVCGNFDIRGFAEFNMLYKVIFRNKGLSYIYTGNNSLKEDIYFTNVGTSEIKTDINCKNGSKSIYQLEGHLKTNNHVILTEAIVSKGLKIPNSHRALSLGDSKIHIGNPEFSAGSVVICSDSMDLNAGHSEFSFDYLSNLTGQFSIQGLTDLHFYNLIFHNQVGIPVLLFNQKSSFNRVDFNGNGKIYGACSVVIPEMSRIDTILFTGKYRYELEENSILNIRKKIINNHGACNELAFIGSTSLANKAYIYSNTMSVISLENVWIENIEASGNNIPFTVINGVNGGNTNNFNFSSFNNSQIFYWNGEAATTHWSNGGNWNIGVEPHAGTNNDILLYNINGCIPGYNDSVVFENNSFPIADTVTINTNANFKGMEWLPGSGNNRVVQGDQQYSLNNYGGLEFDNNLNMYFGGNLIFRSPLLQQIRFNGVTYPGEMVFYNLGKYILQDEMSCDGYSIRFLAGSFKTQNHPIHTNRIIVSHQFAPQYHENMIDLGSSDIFIFNFLHANFVENVSSLVAENSNIKLSGQGSTIFIEGNHSFIRFGEVNFSSPIGNVGLISYGLGGATRPHYKHVNFEPSGYILGENSIDTLILAEGKEYSLEGNKTQYINDLLYSKGSPCFRTTITSTTPGTRAFIKNQNCNLIVEHARIRDIEGIIGGCSVNNYLVGVGGEDMGNNLNWYFIPGNPINGLGPDTILTCKDLPYLQTTLGFGRFESIQWFDGSTGNNFMIDTVITIAATITYSPTCIVNDSRTFGFDSQIIQNAIVNDISCYGSNDGSIQLELSDMDTNYVHTWTNTNNTIIAGSRNIENLPAGEYVSIITVPGYEDMCTDTAHFIINEPGLLTVSLDTTISGKCSDPDGIILITSNGGSGEHSYLWSNELTSEDNYSAYGGTNTVTVSDTNGCIATLAVELNCIEHLNIPELVTPNSDGFGDEWEIIDLFRLYPNNDVKIMNRWGNTVYHKEGYNNEFTGLPNTGDTFSKGYLSSGTYFYVIDLGDGYKTLTGYIELVY